MAENTNSLALDQYNCSVCLEVLKDPATIPCGHNYCMDCIKAYWDQSDTAGIYSCPQCRMEFSPRPVLYKNYMLMDVIGKLKQMGPLHTLSESYAGPNDVPCDICTGRKQSAVKTCLTCLASYCEIHIQPHTESEALKKHKLEHPTVNLAQKLCSKHNKILEMFCRTDQTCICLLCMATEHIHHNAVTTEIERADRQSQLNNTEKELKITIQTKEKKVEDIKETIKSIQSAAVIEVQEFEEGFTSLLQSIQRLRSEVNDLITKQKQTVVRNAETVIEQLEKEIKELKIKDAELAELSKTGDHVHFLQNVPTLYFPPVAEVQSNIVINKDLFPDVLKKNLSNLKKHLQEISVWDFEKPSEDGCMALVCERNLPEKMTRTDFLKYSCQPTFDYNTAHRSLHLSEGNRKASRGSKNRYYDHPDRFNYWSQIICREPLCGARFYWEVEWSGDSVDIGVTYKGISRKGKSDESCLGGSDMSWCICFSDSEFSAWHDNSEIQIDASCSHRIGIYLDYSAGSLSFFNISDSMALIYKFQANFTEPLYPCFWVDNNGSVTICQLI